MSEYKFTVSYSCSNCGEQFKRSYPVKTVIQGAWNGAYVNSPKCTHDIGCKFCHRVECPTCELIDSIRITNRSPGLD